MSPLSVAPPSSHELSVAQPTDSDCLGNRFFLRRSPAGVPTRIRRRSRSVFGVLGKTFDQIMGGNATKLSRDQDGERDVAQRGGKRTSRPHAVAQVFGERKEAPPRPTTQLEGI